MRAYCYKDGVIHFTAGDVPEGALCFAAYEDDCLLKGAIAMSADLHPGGRMFVVPGFLDEPDDNVALELLRDYRSLLKAGLLKLEGV